ncbi:hypothetical protein HXX25_05935 [Hyphobacterium sp. CCMP332]|jgi:hypothetical protein|uniref:hypothetical protein n=1 Tax=Hyphobacterium sp. CCMP332 TaxID=2749086 RepID=UPI00164F292E|nr:hypothetical protein [Hyphobacterium sp. CCMP332]QNL18925.1 hypothetical protein HXX25_05935 [Hyphobacterium sp. CCMP332]
MRIIAAAAAALIVSATAFSDTSTYPQPLADALTLGYDAPDDAVWRFNMRVSMNDDAMELRFDGAQADGEEWTLISPASPDSLSGELADMWVDMNTPDDDDDGDNGRSISLGSGGGLFFTAETARMITGSVERTSGGGYSFSPDLDPDSDEADSMAEHLSGELSVATAGHIERIRIFAPVSFKPNPAARVHEFEMVMDFQRFEGLPAPVMTSMSTVVDVSALFQRQQQNVRFDFSDVEYVEP